MQNENPSNYMFEDEEPVNYREKFEKYAYNWKWFLISIFIFSLGAYAYLKFIPKQYTVTSTILINDENSKGLPSELSAFEDLGLTTLSKTSVDNEIGMLKSFSLMESVVKKLGANITFYEKGMISNKELYKNEIPFIINFLLKDSLVYSKDTTFSILALTPAKFVLKNSRGTVSKVYLFGENVQTDFGNITITPAGLKNLKKGEEIVVKVVPIKNIIEDLRKNIEVKTMFKKSSLIQLILKAPIKLKSQDILNNLVQQYNKDAVDDKLFIGKSTNLFINERLNLIKNELSNVDQGVENFKKNNQLTDIDSESSLILQNNAELEKKIVDLNTQVRVAEYVTDYVNKNTEQIIPSNLGLSDDAVSTNSARYNELLIERNRILKSSSKKNPVIINLDEQLKQLRTGISHGLQNLKASLNIALNNTKKEEDKVFSRIYSAPKQERQFKEFQRQQQIIETLYLFLLQKREENAISLAVTAPKAKIIDFADGSNRPTSPKLILVIITALSLGLLLPFTVLYIIYFFDNKVQSIKDIESIIKAPIIGEIPKTVRGSKIVIHDNDKESISESFRMLRTNINFMLSKIKGRAKIIFIMSTIVGEGKTFTTLNLASVIALSNKKVLLIGGDIRKANSNEYINQNIGNGLSNFLIDNSLKVSDVIERSLEGNFDILNSGTVPPNPSELIMNGRFDEIFAYAKDNYDYVVVDTAPIKMVTDTLLLSHYADLCLYVIRLNNLDKRLLEIPKKMFNEKRLPNMAILINGVDLKRGYGYGQSYGYGKSMPKKNWWKRIIVG
ncbi:GumC family protein [Flavobacterium xueshanense]|uniref:non-specific protein-tyrosine kinase n=1 Tax=Flavobacterium xueshanense TaxID=935223 RepID=A0A1I2J205_9FLAO|nr:tyrosine-protein kinase [Flavobacterium xueshanense]SFF46771.1 capsular exopolysaccharide family [Flavobacterium xueshanense]